jgi:signal transduction histidine kinase
LPEDADATPITKESHRHILMVLKECLNNAVKHSGASRIVVTVEILDDVFRMRIQDNGSGFEQNNSQGNGLFNMKSRMASLGGSLELISRKEDGTLVQAVLPLKSMLPAITTNVV